ncbi:hypothetical protein K3495_g9658 [Podosphaera aphanis]|nr:hypothetical protein K3495_g9658 [Podosphaera aphanis]
MSEVNASNRTVEDPSADSCLIYTGRTFRSGGGAGEAGAVAREVPSDADEVVRKHKQALKEDNLPQRSLKILLAEAIQVINSLRKMKVYPQEVSQTSSKGETLIMIKTLQEIQTIKVTMEQNQSLARPQGQSWAKVTSRPEVAGTTIRIQDETEKKELAKLSSEESVKKIRRKEIIGAR